MRLQSSRAWKSKWTPRKLLDRLRRLRRRLTAMFRCSSPAEPPEPPVARRNAPAPGGEVIIPVAPSGVYLSPEDKALALWPLRVRGKTGRRPVPFGRLRAGLPGRVLCRHCGYFAPAISALVPAMRALRASARACFACRQVLGREVPSPARRASAACRAAWISATSEACNSSSSVTW